MSRAVEQAYQFIRQGIQEGRYAPGERLKETELVAACGVSRTPVRAAISRLVAEDFLEAERNQGARVKVWQRADVDELFDLRALLEGYAAARAAEHIQPAQLAGLEAAVADMDKALAGRGALTRKTSEFLRLNRIVHSTIWEASSSERLVSMLSRLVEQSLQVRTARAYSLERLAESHHHHQELVKALAARDGLWAESTMRSHIRAARDALVRDEGSRSSCSSG